jgi:hypothetical protein
VVVQCAYVGSQPKDERLQIRVSVEDRGMLRALAEKIGESEATVMRQLIRQAFESAGLRGAKKR